MAKEKQLIRFTGIESRIFSLRGQRVMLSTHLAGLYGVQPKVLVQAVKRNHERFPYDFMFQLTVKEFGVLKSQIVTSKGRGGLRRALPYAFTEQGVAMLATVLRSPRAIQTSVEIMRAFVRLRSFLASQIHLAAKLAELEKKVGSHDEEIQTIFLVLKKLMTAPRRPRRQIGFHVQTLK